MQAEKFVMENGRDGASEGPGASRRNHGAETGRTEYDGNDGTDCTVKQGGARMGGRKPMFKKKGLPSNHENVKIPTNFPDN